ncbi:MAG: BspA family leucine-rich repeat surface protein [Flavobacteriaceae bacterium]
MNTAKSTIIRFFLLISFSLISALSKAQNKDYLYLAENGITIIAGPKAQVGGVYTLDAVSYLVVNDSLLRELAKERQDLSKTVTTRVTDMSFLLFKWTDFNQDISHWDVGQVTDFSWMFGYLEQFNGDLSH